MEDDDMKNNIILILLIFAALAIGYFVGVKLTASEWREKIKDSPVKTSTTTVHDTIYAPAETVKVFIKTKVTDNRKDFADSVFKAGLRKGQDWAMDKFAEYTAPEDTTIEFENGSILYHSFDPIKRLAQYKFKPAPMIVDSVFIHDSIFVPIEIPQSWYDHWYVGAIGTGVVYYAITKL